MRRKDDAFCSENDAFYSKVMHCIVQVMHFIVKVMHFIVKVMHFVVEMMHFIVKVMHFIVNLDAGTEEEAEVAPEPEPSGAEEGTPPVRQKNDLSQNEQNSENCCVVLI